MGNTMKLGLSSVGIFIGGTVGYWQLHSGPGVLVTTPTFWMGFIMAGLAPLGSYFLGLAQKAPWDAPPVTSPQPAKPPA